MRDGGAAEEGTGTDGDAGVLDPEQIGALMMEQLFDLLGSWTTMLEAVARQGVDPKPLLQALADTLRRTADQLDPPAP